MALTKVIGAGVGNLDELGVGTASPSYKLHSVTTSGSDYAGFFHNSSGSGNGTALVVKGGANNTGAGTFIVQDYSGNTDLMVDGNGHVTMPYQPAFLVYKSSSQSFDHSTATTISWETEVFDNNADFGSNTFTAPVTGKYQFNINLRINQLDTSANYYQIYFVTSNRTFYPIQGALGFDQDLAYWTMSVSALADLDASDTCYLRIYQSSGATQSSIDGQAITSNFSGFLVA